MRNSFIAFSLLLVPVTGLALAAPVAVHAEEQSKDIVSVATDAGSFKTLAAAIEAAGLAETLKGEGPFTVFAPTDEAFAALPEGVVEALLKPENKEQLAALLTYHVVPGEVKSADIQPGDVATVQGSSVTITVENGAVKVNNASVVSPDVQASNGVIHVVDQVILPNSSATGGASAPSETAPEAAPETAPAPEAAPVPEAAPAPAPEAVPAP
jgi:uncharacterized surface protein with fasciclin (FAS1) repeats